MSIIIEEFEEEVDGVTIITTVYDDGTEIMTEVTSE